MNESEKTKEIGLEETQVIGNAEVFEGGIPEAAADEAAGKKALSRNAKIGIGVGCACALAVAGIGIAFAMSHQATTLPADEPVESAALVAETEEGAAQKVTLGYSGYEPQEGDTPVIVHVSGTTDGNRSVDFYHKVSGASEDMELDPGAYTVEALPVLAKDGSMVEPKDGKATAVSVNDEAAEAKADSQAKPADQVTGDDVKSLLDKVSQAVANGDETLKGDAGKDVAAKVAEAAKATGKVDAEQVEQAEKQAEAASEGEAKTTTFAARNSVSVNISNDSQAAASSSAESAAASTLPAQSAASGSTAGGSPGSSNQPAHEHSWQAVTEQKWVSNNVWVQDSAAWDEQVQTGAVIYCRCGAGPFYSQSDWNAHVNSSKFGTNHGYGTPQPVYETIHHEATGHYEDQGHYETVTTGYQCSCGATK